MARCAPHQKNPWFACSKCNAGRRTKLTPVKSLRESELFLGIFLSEFRCTVFFPLGCGVDSLIPPLQFFQTAKAKAPKEAWGGHLSGGGINITLLRPHEPQLSAMRCVALNCKCMYSCMYIYICIYMLHIHTWKHSHLYIYIYIYLYVHI